MMHRFLLLVSLLVAAAAAESSMSTMPLFAWDASGAVAQNPASVEAALTSALAGKEPEVVMTYMFDETSTQQMQGEKEQFVQLKSVLDNAASSAFAALPVSECTTEGLAATARANGATSVEVQAEDLQKYLESHSVLMSDGKPDVIVVRFGSMKAAQADSLIGAAEKAVAAATSGRFSSLLSTTSSMEPGVPTNLAFTFFQSQNLRSNPSFAWDGKANSLLSQGGNALQVGNALNAAGAVGARRSLWYGTVQYLTPNLMIAILVMIYMGFLLLCAYCCVLSLQTPEKFEGDQEKDMARALNQDAK